MGVSEFTLRLLLIFFPGFVAAFLFDYLTTHKGREFKYFLLNSYLFGFSAYFTIYIFVYCNNLIVKIMGLVPTWKIYYFEWLINNNSALNFAEILWSTISSIFLAIVSSLVVNYQLIHKISNKLRITNKFGAPDVWNHIFEENRIQWVLVRDKENDVMYEGWVQAYSDDFRKNELFIRDVIVYSNSSSQKLYKLDGIYITRPSDQLILEFRKIND